MESGCMANLVPHDCQMNMTPIKFLSKVDVDSTNERWAYMVVHLMVEESADA